jgi:hypothetical protein
MFVVSPSSVFDAVSAQVLVRACDRLSCLAGSASIGSVSYLPHSDEANQSIERLEVVAVVQNPPDLRFCVRIGDPNVPVAPALV